MGGGGDRQTAEWYADRGIEYMLGATVTAVDVSAKTVTVSAASGESTVAFDKLLVATGCEPVAMTDFKIPGADLPGIHYLRDVEDADSLVAAIKGAKAAGSPALVVGGGYIGMECAGAWRWPWRRGRGGGAAAMPPAPARRELGSWGPRTRRPDPPPPAPPPPPPHCPQRPCRPTACPPRSCSPSRT